MTTSIKQGDTGPPLTRTLGFSDGTAQNLTGATVTFRWSPAESAPRGRVTPKSGAVVKSRVATVVSATTGEVRHDWAAGDTDVVGTYVGEFVVTLPSGAVLTFPNRADDWIVFLVVPSLKDSP
jgi:hypothetical protein